MLTTHDDLPHPIPPIAYLRYKENWFFAIIDVSNDVYGMAHFNYEPGSDRARVSCNLMVRGELFKYGNQRTFPADFALARQVGDDRLKVTFVEPHARLDMELNGDDVDLDVCFLKHAPTFDFEDYAAANPEQPSPSEICNVATNQLFHHQQQAMTVAGTLKLKRGARAGETIALKGLGYRDHSRAMRNDNIYLRHVWSCLYFPSTVFGAMSLTSVLRPGVTSNSGYVHDTAGLRSLKEMEIRRHGEIPGNMPATVEYKLNDVYGKSFTVIADIANRMGHVPIVAEPGSTGGFSYTAVENFCPVTLVETGECGYALVELGFSSAQPKT